MNQNQDKVTPQESELEKAYRQLNFTNYVGIMANRPDIAENRYGPEVKKERPTISTCSFNQADEAENFEQDEPKSEFNPEQERNSLKKRDQKLSVKEFLRSEPPLG